LNIDVTEIYRCSRNHIQLYKHTSIHAHVFSTSHV